MALKSSEEKEMRHTVQAFMLAAFFAVVLTALSFLQAFISKESEILRLILVTSIYVVYSLYFVLCITGTVMILKGKVLVFPIVRKYIDKINI